MKRNALYLNGVIVSLSLTMMMVAGLGCTSTYIENTTIPDNQDNRAIYERVMEYRHAMETRDGNALRAMVSRNYYENAATTDRSSDDYGYDKIPELLGELRDNVTDVQLRILMRRISVDGDRAYADYEYYYTFKFDEGGVEGWEPRNDFNRLEFVREDGVWKISGGL